MLDIGQTDGCMDHAFLRGGMDSQGRNYHRGRGGTCLLDFRQVLSKQTFQNRRTVSVES